MSICQAEAHYLRRGRQGYELMQLVMELNLKSLKSDVLVEVGLLGSPSVPAGHCRQVELTK